MNIPSYIGGHISTILIFLSEFGHVSVSQFSYISVEDGGVSFQRRPGRP